MPTQEEEKWYNNHLTLHLKALGKEDLIKSRTSRSKEIEKIRWEINREQKNSGEKAMKNWFYKRSTRLANLLLFWPSQKDTQITRIRNERGNIAVNLVEIKRIMKEHCEQLYVNKLNNPDEMDKSQERQTTKTNWKRNRKSE